MGLYSFYTAYTQLNDLYGVSLTPDEFENIGSIAYDKIGNKKTELKNETLDVVNHRVTLPCAVDSIEAVTACDLDYQRTSSSYDSYTNTYNSITEQYIEHFKRRNDPLYTPGRFVKYQQIDAYTLYIPENIDHVNVLYHKNILEDGELPMLNTKEVDAVACYCAYVDKRKRALQNNDGNLFQIAQQLEAEWNRLCDRARVPESMSQNDFDRIGDVKTSWDRKTYGKSFKGHK